MMRRRGGPGLASTVARTAVVAGTATAVSNKVTAKQVAGAQAKQAAAQQAAAQAQPVAAPAAVAAPVAAIDQQLDAIQSQETAAALGVAPEDLVAQLKQLADLRAAGVLSDAEFEQAKARVLGG